MAQAADKGERPIDMYAYADPPRVGCAMHQLEGLAVREKKRGLQRQLNCCLTRMYNRLLLLTAPSREGFFFPGGDGTCRLDMYELG